VPPLDAGHTTSLISRLGQGDRGAADELYAILHGELRELAGRLMADQRAAHTLQPTALVHEAWLRLAAGGPAALDLSSRAQFFALAARVMRSVLVDHARRRGAQKRGGGALALANPAEEPAGGAPDLDVLALDEALTKLAAFDPDLARLVELRFFAGLPHADIAGTLGCSVRTVEDRWRLARAWLKVELER
jgi:RNA polymerase sigma factor (TIGR02999 family)